MDKPVWKMTQEEFNKICDDWWDSLSDEEKIDIEAEMSALREVGPTIDEYLEAWNEYNNPCS